MMCRQRGGRQGSKCITRSPVLRDTRPLFPAMVWEMSIVVNHEEEGSSTPILSVLRDR